MIIEFLQTNSSAIWGFVGTIIGSLASYLSIRTQLKHARLQNKEDRKASLKKEIYLAAADSFASMQDILIRVGKVGINNIDTSIIQQAPIMRLHFIASPTLIKKLNACQQYFAEATMDLGFDKIAIDEFNLENSQLEKLEKQMSLAKKTVECSSQFSRLLCDCLIDIRKELDEPFSSRDVEDYNNTMKQTSVKSIEKIDQFIQKVREQIS